MLPIWKHRCFAVYGSTARYAERLCLSDPSGFELWARPIELKGRSPVKDNRYSRKGRAFPPIQAAEPRIGRRLGHCLGSGDAREKNQERKSDSYRSRQQAVLTKVMNNEGLQVEQP